MFLLRLLRLVFTILPVSLLRLSAATFSESAPNVATIISKVFFSIDTISIFMQLSVCPQR